jgi:hypothetical protein
MTHPQTLQKTQSWVPEQNNGRKKELGHALNSQHFESKRAY